MHNVSRLTYDISWHILSTGKKFLKNPQHNEIIMACLTALSKQLTALFCFHLKDDSQSPKKKMIAVWTLLLPDNHNLSTNINKSCR